MCSVLFCDVVGFTPLSESRDPEAVRELLSSYFEVARTIIGRYGGTVEKFIGDAVMAVWGTPTAMEGDAERAVRAALDLVAAVPELGTQAGVPGLAARAGVVTGEVAVTLGAVNQGMVAGDAVNTASRVQAAAGPGQVLADGTTHRLAGSAVEFLAAGEHTLKGKSEPARLWRATRVLSGVGGSQRVDGLEAPLTGRDAELRMIRELFHAAAERKVPRLVLVCGPAGTGKSRLGWEFRKYIEGLAEAVWWHQGRCLSYGEGVAFWALAEMVRQRLGIAEEDPAEVAGAKLENGLNRFVPDDSERAYTGARLARLLGVPFAADAAAAALSREELFAGWRLFFERLAATEPVVLLIEDAQYADAGLLDFLDYLVDWSRDLPVYLMVFARPELAQARPGFGAGRNRNTLTLDPLDAASMDALVDALVPGMPTEAKAKITGHAQGIPLFAVETVRSLIDRDVVQPVDGAYRLTGDIGELAVPDSLHALLAARLDALDPGVRQLVADAAVLGTTFPAEALVAVSGRAEPTVRAALADLVRREVLSVSADPLSPERGSYRFAQQMLRQVAYDTLSHRDRKARHLKVAAHLRAAFAGDGEEVAEVVASHYLDALQAIPDDPDTAEIRGLAMGALVRAGERAERTGAPARAAASYAAAAELSSPQIADDQRSPDSAADQRTAGTLWERAAEAAITDAGWAVAVEYAGRARDDHQRRGQARAAARAQATAGRALRLWGRYADAREQLSAAAQVLLADPDTDTVRVMDQLAALEVSATSPDAGRISAEALALGQALGADAGQLSHLFLVRGSFLVNDQKRPEAVAYFRESARLATQIGDNVAVGVALLNLAWALTFTDPAAGAEAARAAATHLRQAGARDFLAYAIANLAQALLELGEWDAAEQEFSQAAAADELADHEFLACHRARLAALRGDAVTAGTILTGLSDLRASEAEADQAFISCADAFTAAARHQPERALRLARATLAHAPALGISYDDLRWAWPLAARCAHELGDATATRELLALLDSSLPGHLAPMLRAESELARARLAAAAADAAADATDATDADAATDAEATAAVDTTDAGAAADTADAADAADADAGAPAALAAAVTGLRELSTPYHLAHGLLDHAEYLVRHGQAEAAAVASGEARDIALRLRCRPLLDRAEAIDPTGAIRPTGIVPPAEWIRD